jgi:hypothetical protein
MLFYPMKSIFNVSYKFFPKSNDSTLWIDCSESPDHNDNTPDAHIVEM